MSASRSGARRRLTGLALSTLVAAAPVVLTNCARSPGDTAVSEQAPVYRVRGVVLEAREDEGRVRIRHEPLPEFRDATGQVVGMDGMAMWFGADDFEGLVEGVEIEFDLRIDWYAERALDRSRVVGWTRVSDVPGSSETSAAPEP